MRPRFSDVFEVAEFGAWLLAGEAEAAQEIQSGFPVVNTFTASGRLSVLGSMTSNRQTDRTWGPRGPRGRKNKRGLHLHITRLHIYSCI